MRFTKTFSHGVDGFSGEKLCNRFERVKKPELATDTGLKFRVEIHFQLVSDFNPDTSYSSSQDFSPCEFLNPVCSLGPSTHEFPCVCTSRNLSALNLFQFQTTIPTLCPWFMFGFLTDWKNSAILPILKPSAPCLQVFFSRNFATLRMLCFSLFCSCCFGCAVGHWVPCDYKSFNFLGSLQSLRGVSEFLDVFNCLFYSAFKG